MLLDKTLRDILPSRQSVEYADCIPSRVVEPSLKISLCITLN